MFCITKTVAQDLLKERIDFWVNAEEAREQWHEYLDYWVEEMEGTQCYIDPITIIDNMYVNELEFIDKEDIVDYNLEVGTHISTADFEGTIEYVGKDFIVLNLR